MAAYHTFCIEILQLFSKGYLMASSAEKKAPGPGIGAIPRTLKDFPRNPIKFSQGLWQKYGDIVRFWIGPFLVHLISGPEEIKHVLQDNNQNYSKGRVYDAFKPVIGNGLLTSEGDFWRRQRRLANPSFRHDKIRGFVSMFAEQSQALLEEWETYARTGQTIDIAPQMMRLTFGIVGRALFSADLEKDAREVGEAITVALAEASRRADILIPIPLWLPIKSNWRYKRAIQTMDAYVFNLIQERRQSENRPFDLLTMLIEAVDDETNESMTDRQLRDEVITFMLAGHETTAVALTWTLYLLAEHPEAAEKVRAECRRVVGDKPPDFEALKQLHHTRMVFEESLRLYPPLPFIARSALKADTLGGYPIRQNALIMLSQFLTHHHPTLWENPDDFQPERFTPEAGHNRSPMAYFPFSRGQRMCIGADFATTEALVFLSMALQKYRVERVSTAPVELLEQVTLRPKGGMPVRIVAQSS